VNWRKWNNLIHRDLGYLCVGLTLIYAVSGVAVNHADRWNPSYEVAHLHSHLDRALAGAPVDQGFVEQLLASLDERGRYLNSYQPDPQTLQVFVEGDTITVNLATGEIFQEKVEPRPLLRQVNFLHLNHPKKLWTWFADLYAVCLAVLALTGLFVLPGKTGISGRGGWLAGLGLLLPLFFLWLYY
jgi:hypothetical protein